MFMDNFMKFSCHKTKKSKTDLEQIAEYLKVIAESNRLKILCILRKQEKCVCEIWQFLNLPQNLISHHLKILKDFGLIGSRKESTKVFYFLNKKIVEKYTKLLNKVLIK